MNIEEKIVNCIKGLSNQVMGKSNRISTDMVKSVFVRLGHSLQWQVCATSPEAGVYSEWLFDLTWYKYNKDADLGLGLEIGLVLESEWSNHYSDLKYDFEKLLVAKSPYKVFVFQATEAEKTACVSKFVSAIANCAHSSSGDTYIFGCWTHEKGAFDVIIKKIS